MSTGATSRTLHMNCPRCKRETPLPNASGEVTCAWCRLHFTGRIYTPPVRRAQRALEAGLGPTGNAVCGNHPRNVAAHGCTRCGMFICHLCVIETDGMTLCPGCYDRLSNEGALVSTRTKFRDMAGLAATSIAAGIFMWPFMPLTGPLAIGYSVKALKQRRELGDLYSPTRIWIGLLLGVAQTLGGIAILVALTVALVK
jgi:hypothetical protein